VPADDERAAHEARLERVRVRVGRELSDKTLERQWLVYELHVRFKSQRAIAAALHISRHTIRADIAAERARRQEMTAASRAEITERHIALLDLVIERHVEYMESPVLRKGNEAFIIIKASDRILMLRGVASMTPAQPGRRSGEDAAEDTMLANLPDDLFASLVEAFANRKKPDVQEIIRSGAARH
jgi:hypothetical protein